MPEGKSSDKQPQVLARTVAVRCDQMISISFCGLIASIPFSSGAVQFFIYFILLCFLVRLSFYRTDLRFQAGALDVAIACWIFFCILSIIVNPFAGVGWRGLLLKVLPGVGVFYAFTQIMTDEKRLRLFWTSLFIAIFVLCIDGIWQYIFGTDLIRHRQLSNGRVFATMKAPNSMATYLMTFAPLMLMMAWGGRELAGFKFLGSSEQRSRVFLSVLFILAVFSLGLTYSRGGWLSFAIAMAGVAIIEKRLRWPLAVLLCGFFFYFVHKMVGERQYMTASLVADSFGRQTYWKEAWILIRHHWLLGSGLNAYQYAVQPYKLAWGYYPHNCYLQMWAETGILGVLSFWAVQGIVLIGALVAFLKGQGGFKKNCLAGLALGYGGFLFHSVFDTFFYSASLGILIWLMMAQIRVLSVRGDSA